MKEYRSIGELANIFGMDVQLLRYYDARGILVPSVRNEANGRRYYHFDQVYPLATIRDSIAALYAEGARRGYELADTVVTLNIIDQFSEGHPSSYVTALETRILPAWSCDPEDEKRRPPGQPAGGVLFCCWSQLRSPAALIFTRLVLPG